MARSSAVRIGSVGRKEFLHILRDPQTLFFIIFVPVMELFLLGYAIDTNVRHIRTIVADLADTQESRNLLKRFENSQDFDIVKRVHSGEQVTKEIVAGTGRVGIVIPADYSQKLEAGRSARIQILIDGTESSIASEAVNVSNAIALRESLERELKGKELPVEAMPRVLFNPSTRSANFFIPGLMVVMCQMMATLLAATAIVREKEQGTLEQLLLSPIRRWELIIGKMTPYVVLTMVQFSFIAFLMRVVFLVPIHGSFITLLMLALPFTLAMLALGLIISTKADTREAATQMTTGTILPSIFLSGYVFPTDSMPEFFSWVSQAIPTTWMIDAARSVILRGTGYEQLWVHSAVLWGMAFIAMVVASLKFRKQV